jgi:hypothetical protein
VSALFFSFGKDDSIRWWQAWVITEPASDARMLFKYYEFRTYPIDNSYGALHKNRKQKAALKGGPHEHFGF